MIELELPFPPSVNHYWRMWRGRMVIGDKGRTYRSTVATILRGAGVQPLIGSLAVAIEAFPPDRRRRDLDNLLKAIGDSLQHAGAFLDDSQIVWLLIEKAQVIPHGKIKIRIAEGLRLTQEPGGLWIEMGADGRPQLKGNSLLPDQE